MDLRELLAALRKRWAILVLVPIAGVVLALAYSVTSDPVYESSTTLAVKVVPAEGELPRSEDISVSIQLTDTYARLLTSRPVLAEVAERQGRAGDSLSGQVDTKTDATTQLIEVDARAGSPEAAAAVATELATVAQDRAASLAVGGSLIVVEPASEADQVAPRTLANVAIGLAIGGTLALTLILLLEATSGPIRNADELSALVGLDIVGSIREINRRAGDDRTKAALLGHYGYARTSVPRGVLDDYMLARAQIEYATRDTAAEIVLITAPDRNSGSSTTAANLALVLARRNMRVLLVDADLREPAQHTLFGISGEGGLAAVLQGDEVPAALVHHLSDNLAILPAGSSRAFSADLLSGMGEALDELRVQFDLVLVDGPPLLDSADSLLLADTAQAAVLVVDATRTKSASVVKARQMLDATRTPVLGIILNRVGRSRWRPPSRRDKARDRAVSEAGLTP